MSDRFRLGVNYWPARTAMSWWSQFDPSEVANDFARIAACGLDSVRVFLTWEDFQPAPNDVDRTMLDRLVTVADLAGGSGLALIPTLFTGHMSSVNWIPTWALGGSDGEGPLDEQLLPFLARVTRWLGNGKEVLFSEFGLPTRRARSAARDPRLADENAAAVYTASALEALRDAGCLGAMLWCYSDYERARWSSPPLDLATHERSFGLWRADGSPKPVVAAIAAFAGATRRDAGSDDSWIDIGPDDFVRDPGRQLPRLYSRYRRS